MCWAWLGLHIMHACSNPFMRATLLLLLGISTCPHTMMVTTLVTFPTTVMVDGVLGTPSTGMATSADKASPAGGALPSRSLNPANDIKLNGSLQQQIDVVRPAQQWLLVHIGACATTRKAKQQRLLAHNSCIIYDATLDQNTKTPGSTTAPVLCKLTATGVLQGNPAKGEGIAGHAAGPKTSKDGAGRHIAGH